MALPFDRIVVLDFETRYSTKPQHWCPDGYTLRKQTTEEYVRSPMFKDFGASLKEFSAHAAVAQWYSPEELRRVFSYYDWSRTAVVCQNAAFDVAILSWQYGIEPAFIFDTLSMARALRGTKGRNGLKALAQDFGLPDKGEALMLTDGLEELPQRIERELAVYCNHDVYLCEEVFKRFLLMYPSAAEGVEWDGAYDRANWLYPEKELRLIDMTVRMFTRPLLVLDGEMLGLALVDERETREGLLKRLNISDSDLASNDKFAEILRSLGVEPPLKKKRPTVKTPNPVGMNFAFAKTDAGFQSLLAHMDDNVVLLSEARLKVKSTTERTRAQRFLDISHRGTLPVPLHYYGALTGRWTAAAGAAINMQNLKRGSFLRKAIMAPEGSTVVVVDLSQIEPRVLAWLADYEELLDIFRSGKDAYAMFGAQMFNIPGMTKTSHPELRQSAKSALLGAGYGLGWASFAAQLLVGFLGAPPVLYRKEFAKTLGVGTAYIERFLDWDDNVVAMHEIQRNCTAQELLIHCVTAKKIIDIYRATAAPVKGFWDMCTSLIQSALADGQEYDHKGALLFRKEEIVLPSGMSIKYPNLRQVADDVPDAQGRKRMQWVYGDERTKLYAGKITNNCLAEGTEVLTERGWVSIEQVRKEDAVHDGVGFVQHDGIVANGVQGCMTVDGVMLTPEHLVLTQEGWLCASQVQEPYRPDIRHVDCDAPRVLDGPDLEVAIPMPMRRSVREDRGRSDSSASTGEHSELRLYEGVASAREQHARHDTPQGVHRMAEHEKPLLQKVGTGVQKLRGARHSSLLGVAQVRFLLEGHGAYLPSMVVVGTDRQREGVRPRELHVGDKGRAVDEPQIDGSRCERISAESRNRNSPQHAVHAFEGGVACGAADTSAFVQKQVFDILNCGPRNRFVVRGLAGPFIVHNCTQGLARIVMTDGLLRVAERIPLVFSVHDEGVGLVPEAQGAQALAWMIRRMTEEPKYMPGLPLAADGGFHRRYGLAKG